MHYTCIIRGTYPEPWQSCPVFETAQEAEEYALKFSKLVDNVKIEVYEFGNMIKQIDNSKTTNHE